MTRMKVSHHSELDGKPLCGTSAENALCILDWRDVTCRDCIEAILPYLRTQYCSCGCDGDPCIRALAILDKACLDTPARGDGFIPLDAALRAIETALSQARSANGKPQCGTSNKDAPADRGALERSIAELEKFEREGISLCEVENEVSLSESVMLCLHELKRLRSAG